jgi:hypothetical protein
VQHQRPPVQLQRPPVAHVQRQQPPSQAPRRGCGCGR